MSSINVNLLPYRQQRQKQISARFFVAVAISLIAGAAVIGLLSFIFFTPQISSQQGSNASLESEISRLDQQIKEIDGLQAKSKDLLSRKTIVENLQANRARVVIFMNFLANPPEGIQFQTLTAGAGNRQKDQINFKGVALSPANVTSLANLFKESDILENVRIVEVVALKQQYHSFSIDATLKNLAPPPEDEKPKRSNSQTK